MTDPPAVSSAPPATDGAVDRTSLGLLSMRCVVGGVLMGLANLVPGISGGTMLVASGIYTRFINAIADLTRLSFRFRSMLVLAVVVASAFAAIVMLAGPVKDLVIHHRWIMYSLFIGLTLGGVPVVWKMARPGTRGLWTGAVIGFLAMAGLAIAQQYFDDGGAARRDGLVMMFIAGLAGASAMILPGISGGYLLLVLGAYVPILAAIDQCKLAIDARQFDALSDPMLAVVAPVGVGVIVGVVVVSNALRWLLKHQPKPTFGVLLGLLMGAVVGLWPFQQTAPADQVNQVKGRAVMLVDNSLVYAIDQSPVDPADMPTVFFRPTVGQSVGSVGLAVAGFAATALIARLGRDRQGSAGAT